MFIGFHVNLHVESELGTRSRLESEGSGIQAYMVTGSLSASLVMKLTELSSSTIQRRVSDASSSPFTAMSGKLFAAETQQPTSGWRRGVVVSGVRRMNEVNARRARLVSGWVTVFGRVYHLGM